MAQGAEISVPILREAARDPRGEVRALACHCLAEGGGDSSVSVPLLIAAADDGQEDVRLEAARGLGQVARSGSILKGVRSPSGASGGLTPAMRDDALRILRRLLKDPSSRTRAEAAGALGEFGPDSAVAADLTAAAGDDDRAVRLAAARALIKLNGPDDHTAARTLVALVASPDAVPDRAEVLQVVKTMSEAVQDRAVAALVELLSRADPDVAPDVIACLPGAGRPARAALPALEALLNGPEPGLRADAGMAIVAIEGQENPQVVPSGFNGGMSGGAGMAMMGMSGGAGVAIPATAGRVNPRVVSVLVRIVADAEVQRDTRANALGMVLAINPAAPAKATPDLVRQLADRDPNVRRTALDLLSGIIDVAPAELPPTRPAR
jgi:HEAT repeat protein